MQAKKERNMIRVIVADDHAVVRTGLQLIMDATPDIEIVDEVSRGNDLLKKLKQKGYDVVVLDLSMPGKDGLDVLKEIKIVFPQLPVVIFSMNPDGQFASRLFKNGASAYINKETNPEELIKAIRVVARGKKYYTAAQAEKMVELFTRDEQEVFISHEKLTDREFQIMCMLASGTRKGEIADLLSVSKNTISNHRNNILKKMQLQNNSDITRYALQHGIIN
jgi:DNA-binding NarL/FixJ family response regulator